MQIFYLCSLLPVLCYNFWFCGLWTYTNLICESGLRQPLLFDPATWMLMLCIDSCMCSFYFDFDIYFSFYAVLSFGLAVPAFSLPASGNLVLLLRCIFLGWLIFQQFSRCGFSFLYGRSILAGFADGLWYNFFLTQDCHVLYSSE